MVAPVAFRLVEFPAHNVVGDPLAATVGNEITVSDTFAVAEQVPCVPVTVYVVLVVGEAVGVAEVELLSDPAGSHT